MTRVLIDDYGKSISKPPVTSSMDDESVWKPQKKKVLKISEDDLNTLIQAKIDATLGKEIPSEQKIQDDTRELREEYQLDDATEMLKDNRINASEQYDEKFNQWKQKQSSRTYIAPNKPKDANDIAREQLRKQVLKEKREQKLMEDDKLEERVKLINEENNKQKNRIRREQDVKNAQLREEQSKLEQQEQERIKQAQRSVHKEQSLQEFSKLDSETLERKKQEQLKLEENDKRIVEETMAGLDKKCKNVRTILTGTKFDKIMRKKFVIPLVLVVIFVAFLIYYLCGGS